MQVLLAQPRGFCAGVTRAIAIVERALAIYGAPIYVRHEIVHNRTVVESLRARGAVFVDNLSDVPEGATVVFSAHGVPKAVAREAEERGLRVFDATCPLVTKVHKEVGRMRREGRTILMIGHAGHPEVEGTMGQVEDGIRLIADVVDRKKEGEELIRYTFEKRRLVDSRIGKLAENERVRAYMANPNLTTYGSGKYTGLMMERAGAYNVAAKTIKGFKQVSIEEVIGWDPAVIFVQDRYPKAVKEILSDPAWAGIKAVKDKKVYLMPEYAKAWGYPMPEAMAIGELWMAKKLYPEKFADIDMTKAADDYYQRFYRVHWTADDEKQ